MILFTYATVNYTIYCSLLNFYYFMEITRKLNDSGEGAYQLVLVQLVQKFNYVCETANFQSLNFIFTRYITEKLKINYLIL